MVLKGCFYVGGSLCSLFASDIFGVRAVFGMDACCIFPQSMLAIVPSIGGVFGVVVTRVPSDAGWGLFALWMS